MALKNDRRKEARRVPLPAGLAPLLTQRELETRYGVSLTTVRKWIAQGMPVEPVAGVRGLRFDLARVEAWHAREAAGERQLASA